MTDRRGQVAIETVTSEVLKDNSLGDPHVRDLFVYLPPGYDDGTKSFPTIYLLTGFTGRGAMLLNVQPFVPTIAERMDRLISTGSVEEMIVVMPDCFTHLGGSQYIDSSATGQYEKYVVSEIVPFVDRKFRTVQNRNKRAVMGKSSGGYGALVLGMRHPEVFGVVVSHSGDCYFEYCYLPDFPKAVRALKGDVKGFLERFWNEEKKEKDDFAVLNILAMSACYSPDPAEALGFKLPFDLRSGKIHPAVWARWLEQDPVRMAAVHADALRSLKLLYVDAGTRDEYGLDLGARIFVERLREMQIEHVFEEFDDVHFNISYRYDTSLALVSRVFRG